MTPEMALLMGKRLAKRHKILLYKLVVRPMNLDYYALTSYKTGEVIVNESYLYYGQSFILEAWLHEFAHVRTPGRGEHGPRWRETFENFMKCNGAKWRLEK